jgi:predicted transcriptional regulator
MGVSTKKLDDEIVYGLMKLSVKQKKTVLTVVKTFINEQQDWWDELGEEQQKAIDKSLLEVKNGKLTTHNEVMKRYSKWLKK